MLTIRNLRKDNKMSQQELADVLNITREALSHYETGRREPNLRIMMKMSEYFGVSIDYLVTGREYVKSDRKLK